MDTETNLQNVEEILKPLVKETRKPEENRLDFILPAENLLQAVRTLKEHHWGYLSFITGLDHPVAKDDSSSDSEGHIEVLYHFAKGAAIATLRVAVPYSKAEVPTLCGLIPSATIYERELMEMFGVVVLETPNPAKLLLPYEWPDGVYPLRKSFQVPTGTKPSSET